MESKFLAVFMLCLLGGAQAWWKPDVATTWQIVLSKDLKNATWGVQAYDFDVFDNPKSTITSLHADNRTAICYFSAGSWENWRPDAGEFKKSDLGRPLSHWPGERWLNVMSPNVRKIMAQRMDLAVRKGCDAVDPDNVDAYSNGGGGFNLTEPDAINYVKFLATEAHKRNLAVSLKNAGAIIHSVLSDVDFSVNEQCLEYHECDTWRPFIEAGKPIFHIEYVKGTPPNSKVHKICSNKTSRDFSTLIKHLNLAEWEIACPLTGTDSANTQKSGSSSTPSVSGTRKSSKSSTKPGTSAASRGIKWCPAYVTALWVMWLCWMW